MTTDCSIDKFLAASVRGGPQPWPESWSEAADRDRLIARARYHGISALLLDSTAAWPAPVRDCLVGEARREAIWELHHRTLLDRLLGELKLREVAPLFLKGTALAYTFYPSPAVRSRADSDLLIRAADLTAAREALGAAGLVSTGPGDDGALQESWSATVGGMRQTIDLHLAPFNAAFLAPILTTEESFACAQPLDGLGQGALMLAGPQFLLHVCVHRNNHRTAPYFSGGKAMLSADRLIWAVDIARLTATFSTADWTAFIDLASEKRVARAMAEALDFAERCAAAVVPADVRSSLGGFDGTEDRSAYMLDFGRRRRALANLIAGGVGQAPFRRLRALLSPDEAALRARYPSLARYPRPALLARRMFDFLTARSH